MTGMESFPLQRMFNVADLKPEGSDFTVETTAQERAALADFLKLPSIRQLTGTFHLAGNSRQVAVNGSVHAVLEQVCSVSLDPFETELHEDIELIFRDSESIRQEAQERAGESDDDEPDELIDGQIDLGALTAEFLALGLDPYPRKPGVEFSYNDGSPGIESPFAALSGLKSDRSRNND